MQLTKVLLIVCLLFLSTAHSILERADGRVVRSPLSWLRSGDERVRAKRDPFGGEAGTGIRTKRQRKPWTGPGPRPEKP